MTKPDSLHFRQVMGRFATGIAVATVDDTKIGRAGITINSLTSVSLDPPLVLFCLDKCAHLHPVFRRADEFVINILSAGQEDISRHFANFHRYPEPKGLWKPKCEAPILRGTLCWLRCRTSKIYKGGDHDIFLGEVVELQKSSQAKEPLLYFQGAYGQLA